MSVNVVLTLRQNGVEIGVNSDSLVEAADAFNDLVEQYSGHPGYLELVTANKTLNRTNVSKRIARRKAIEKAMRLRNGD